MPGTTFLSGFASAVDLGGVSCRPDAVCGSAREAAAADSAALCGDWAAIGEDIREAARALVPDE